ncbi:MAG TPA: adenylate/guanylate cyclase domain-containing protein, partial [Actinomycetota bacterium]|nr:adenylate/guanylate cyclase domain-containing protein [Actinomycetota bacterium]
MEQGREERKVVTVLFCDLVGFTARSDQADPEDVSALLRPYHAMLRREIEGFGGTVDKFIGDGVMAVFGAPAAHEDDPERAVRAGLRILEAIEELNEAEPALELQVRVGVMSGEALVVLGGDQESEQVVGDVVNTASRLEGLAPVGGVLVGETTWRATRHAISYRPVAPVVAKGKAEPLAVWQALEPIASLGVDVRRRGRVPLVGRRAALARLRDALTRVRADRAPRLVALVGTPGIGKSRLVAELLAAVDAEPELTTWRQGRSLPYGQGVTFWALGEMVKAQAGILESDPAEAAGAKLARMAGELLGDPAEAGWVEGHLRPLVGLAAPAGLGADRQHEAFAAWRRVLEALAAQGPAVLVFEDLHWADDALLDFVEHLLEWAAEVPLLVVVAARPELLTRRPGWDGRQRTDVVQVGPLSEGDTARLLAALLETSVLPAELQTTLLTRSGGNPLYAEEYVRMLTDRGQLGPGKGGAGRAARLDALPLPETVQALVAARIDALGPEEKAVLADAAVLGSVVWLGALAELAGRPREDVRRQVEVLERREFLRAERRSAVAGERQYSFGHVVVRDVAYGQIPRAARADRHRRAAEWIASLTPDRAEDRAELLAHHWSRALSFARAARQDDTDLAHRAGQALRDAGDRAAALNAFGAATRFYAGALELAAPGDPARPALLFGLGQARMHAEHAGEELLADAAEALLGAGDLERAAEARALLGRLLRRQGHGQLGMRHLREAAALLAGGPPSRSHAFVLVQLAGALVIGGESAEAVQTGRAALAIIDDLGLDSLRAEALQWVGAGRLDGGDRGGVDDLERAAEIAVRTNSPAACTIVANLATTRSGFGDLARAVELHAEARRLAERFGDASMLRYLGVEDAWDRYLKGRWDEALRLAGDWLAEGEGSAHYMESTCRIVRGRVLLARGEVARALADADAALALADEAEDLVGVHEALGLRICALLADGQAQAAEASAARLLALIRDQEGVGMTADWSADISDALTRLGRGAELAGL